MAISGGPDIIQDGLVLSLDAADRNSYPGSGTTWRDLSGNNNTGTLTNGPTFSNANQGSVVFDGTNDYVDCGTSFTNLTTQLTITFWGRINGSPIDGILITKGEQDGTATSNFGFQIRPSNSLRLYAKASGASYTVIDSNTGLWDNNTNNYTLVYNSGNVIFYKNGTSFSSHSFGLSTLPTSIGPLYVGFLKGYTGYYPGNIFNVQVHTRALSATEILQNYNAIRTRFNL